MLTVPNPNTSIPNELEWIGSFLSLGRKLSGDDIESVRNFSLLWNLFEGLVCNKSASVGALENAVSYLQKRNRLKIDDYEKFLKYFSNRYMENGEINHRFGKLNLRGSDKAELVEAVLKGIETAPEKALLAILIIVYRYRNNLFHGEKSIYDLPNQIDNFRNANQLLMVFMENWKAANS
jgi:hypothetical protein